MVKTGIRQVIRELIREVMIEERHVDPDSATIKYKKHKDVESSTIDEPRKHDPTSATIKEKRGYTQKEIMNLYKKNKSGSIEVFVRGGSLSIDSEDMLERGLYGIGLDTHGREKNFKYKDVEFVEVDGKRV